MRRKHDRTSHLLCWNINPRQEIQFFYLAVNLRYTQRRKIENRVWWEREEMFKEYLSPPWSNHPIKYNVWEWNHFSSKFIGRHVKGVRKDSNYVLPHCKPLLRKRACAYIDACVSCFETRTQGSVEHLTTGCQSVSQAHPLSQHRKYCNCPARSFLRDIRHQDITGVESQEREGFFFFLRFINLLPLKPISLIKIRIYLLCDWWIAKSEILLYTTARQ